jgi:hypothetical protein
MLHHRAPLAEFHFDCKSCHQWLHSDSGFSRCGSAKHLKMNDAGAKAHHFYVAFTARLKSCPDASSLFERVLPQFVKSHPIDEDLPMGTPVKSGHDTS